MEYIWLISKLKKMDKKEKQRKIKTVRGSPCDLIGPAGAG